MLGSPFLTFLAVHENLGIDGQQRGVKLDAVEKILMPHSLHLDIYEMPVNGSRMDIKASDFLFLVRSTQINRGPERIRVNNSSLALQTQDCVQKMDEGFHLFKNFLENGIVSRIEESLSPQIRFRFLDRPLTYFPAIYLVRLFPFIFHAVILAKNVPREKLAIMSKFRHFYPNEKVINRFNH